MNVTIVKLRILFHCFIVFLIVKGKPRYLTPYCKTLNGYLCNIYSSVNDITYFMPWLCTVSNIQDQNSGAMEIPKKLLFDIFV